MHSILKKLVSLLTLTLLVFDASANDFRHKDIKQRRQSYYYITIGLILPLTNTLNDVGGVFDKDFYREIVQNAGGSFDNKDKYPTQKIGAMAGIGLKTPYFFRFEAKLDFLTFTKKYNSEYTNYKGERVSVRPIDMTVRQFGFFINSYIDFDILPSITPYVGGGLGILFMNGVLLAKNNNGNTLFEEANKSYTNFFGHELNSGIRFGSKIASFSIEGFVRKTQKIELTTKGVILKVAFQL